MAVRTRQMLNELNKPSAYLVTVDGSNLKARRIEFDDLLLELIGSDK